MTDKQIIIDGVDVSGCIYYKATGKYNTCGYCCEQNPNCYYKQLKRKERECEELKEQLTILNGEAVVVEITVEQFEEYKKLKAENDEYSLFIEKLCDYAGLECDNEEQAMRTLSDLASQMNKARWIIDRYKQTLTEIKEIAEKIDDSGGCAYGDYDCDNCSSLEQETVCTYKVKKLILQKISECEGNNE